MGDLLFARCLEVAAWWCPAQEWIGLALFPIGVVALDALAVRVQEGVEVRVRLQREIGLLLPNNHCRACHVCTPAEARAALPRCSRLSIS